MNKKKLPYSLTRIRSSIERSGEKYIDTICTFILFLYLLATLEIRNIVPTIMWPFELCVLLSPNKAKMSRFEKK